MNYWYAVTYAYGEHRINHGSTQVMRDQVARRGLDMPRK